MAIGHQRQHGAGPVVVGVALIVIFASAVTVAAAVAPGPSPSAAAPGAAGVHRCRPDQVRAAAGPSTRGGAATSGVVVRLRDVAGQPCSLRGTPEVSITAARGAVPRHARPPRSGGDAVVLRSGSAGAHGSTAEVGVTWTGWGCASSPYTLGVRFAGWSHPVTTPYAATSGAAGSSGARCAGAGSRAVVVGPVGWTGG